MTLDVVLEHMRDNWCAYAPDDQFGVIAVSGSSREEAVANFRTALMDHFTVMRERGFVVPHVDKLNLQELVPV